MAVRSLANLLYSSSMYSGGSTRGAPGCMGGPRPDRLKVRRTCPRRLSSRLCMSSSLSCSRKEGSTIPPRPSSSPGAGRCLSGELMGLVSPERGPKRSRRKGRKGVVVANQHFQTPVPAMVRGERGVGSVYQL